MRKPRILFIPLEFPRWQDASRWSYPLGFGLEEGFTANGISCVTIPAMFHPTREAGAEGSLLAQARELCAGKIFDVVFVEINHSRFADSFLNWLTEIAPMRVGILPESISIDPGEYSTNPAGTKRRVENAQRNLSYMTHVIAVDSQDIADFKQNSSLQTFWLNNLKIPSRFIVKDCPEPSILPAVFYGTLYGERREWLEHPELQGILVRPESSPEMLTQVPAAFDQLQDTMGKIFESQHRLSEQELDAYLQTHRTLRQEGYRLWLQGLQASCAVVNLPQYGRIYAGRVAEAMAAGRPAISWDISAERPIVASIFAQGEEILLFPRDNPHILAEHIKRLQRDKDFARKIAQNALNKMKSEHTVEIFVSQVLTWLTSGNQNVVRAIAGGAPEKAAVVEEEESLSEVEKAVQEHAARGSQQLLAYLIPIVAVLPQSRAEVIRCWYACLHLEILIDSARFDLLWSLCSSINAPKFAFDCLRRIARTYRIPEKEVTTISASVIIPQLEVPGIFGGWRMFWVMSTCLSKLSETFSKQTSLQHAEDFKKQDERMNNTATDVTNADDVSSLEQLRTAGLASADKPLRLHLGCGETHLDGYINIDYPPSEHNVMTIVPDVYADIVSMHFPPESVDEIRLHHVFEHFSRVTALAMLIKWQQWLKVGGKLHIETPDLLGCAKNIVTNPDFTIKMGNVRHLAGDQAASWAYHVDHWFEERFQHTLTQFGFAPVQTSSTPWQHPPYLWNVEVTATKAHNMELNELLTRADCLLWQSTVSPNEKPTYEVWCKQLRTVLNGEDGPKLTNTTPERCEQTVDEGTKDQRISASSYLAKSEATTETIENLVRLWDILRPQDKNTSIPEVSDFNQRERNRWVATKAATLSGGQRVLDVGAGTCPYKELFTHCIYETHDFKQYSGVKLGGTAEYGHIDYVSDIKRIPVADASFDVILCTEVLEHVPEPIEALREMARIVKPEGKIWITAPLGSGLHQLPFHFYGGYTPQWYQYFCNQFGLDIEEITPNGGFFKMLSQEVARSAQPLIDTLNLKDQDQSVIREFFQHTLPLRLFELDSKYVSEQFTVGYFVEAVKPPLGVTPADPAWKEIQRRLNRNPSDIEGLVNAAIYMIEKKRFGDATAFGKRALALEPNNEQLQQLMSELSKM